MKPLVAVIFSVLLTLLPGCSGPPTGGRVLFSPLPTECNAQALAEIHLPVIIVDKLPYAPGERAFGLWKKYPNGERVILLRRDAPPDVLAHELCHEVMFRLTGDHRFHP